MSAQKALFTLHTFWHVKGGKSTGVANNINDGLLLYMRANMSNTDTSRDLAVAQLNAMKLLLMHVWWVKMCAVRYICHFLIPDGPHTGKIGPGSP